MVKKKAKAKAKKRLAPIKKYSLDNRLDFANKVVKLRRGTKERGSLTYGGIAAAMNVLGFRNRNYDPKLPKKLKSGEITSQFIGNILHRRKTW